MSNVKVVKFVSGQEVISKVIENENELILESPLTVQAMRTQEGLGIGLVPFSFASSAKQVVINRSNVLCVLEAEDQLASQYLAGLAGLTLSGTDNLPRVTLS